MGNHMSNTIRKKIRHIFENMLGWSLVKKSQAMLIYAIFTKTLFYFILFYYQHHPVFDPSIATPLRHILIGSIVANIVLIGIGFVIKTKTHLHVLFSFIVMIYYTLAMLIVPIMIGILNVVNGLILIVTILICMVFFPKRICYTVETIFVVGYFIIVSLTLLHYLDYGLIFKPNALIHPLLSRIYLIFSVLYSTIFIFILLYLFRLCINAWREKIYSKEHMANYRDELTGLFNHCGLRQVASLQLQQAYLVDAELSLVILDIDNFKRILKQYGPEYEQNILKHVADILCNNLRKSDMIARYDVEQFILILAFTPLSRAEDVAEMCRKTLEQSLLPVGDGQHINIKASFGLSSTVHDDFDFQSLLSSATKALNVAKENGKNQVCSIEAISHL